MSGTEKQCKKQQKLAKMAKNETDSGLFVALNIFSHLSLCLSKKIRCCFKSFDIFQKTSDFFHTLAGTDYQYHRVEKTRRHQRHASGTESEKYIDNTHYLHFCLGGTIKAVRLLGEPKSTIFNSGWHCCIYMLIV